MDSPLAAEMVNKLILFAEKLADASQVITLKYFRKDLRFESKADKSPVSLADKEAEAAIRKLIKAEYPNHGIIGEEYGSTNIDAEFIWVIDPIDGTQSYITGKPLFGSLISLLFEGQSIIGIINMPALNERWVGAKDRPTLFQGKVVETRSCNQINKAWLYATSPHKL